MYNRIVHVGELTDSEKESIENIALIKCSDIECKYCQLAFNLVELPHTRSCLRKMAQQVLEQLNN